MYVLCVSIYVYSDIGLYRLNKLRANVICGS